MDTQLCSRCGRPLEEGICPKGHSQRGIRRRSRRRRRLGRWLAFPLLLGVLGGGSYAGLVWYPPFAAADVIGPASADFAKAVRRVRDTNTTFPAEADERAFLTLANAASRARRSVDVARARLEGRTLPGYPIVSSRPAIQLAEDIRERMLDFYTDTIDFLAELQRVSNYVSAIAPLFPTLADLEGTLGNATKSAKVQSTLAAAVPITNTLRAELRATDAPDELGELHERLRATVSGIAGDLEQVGDLVASRGGKAILIRAGPVILSLYGDIRERIASFQNQFSQIPMEALEGGLQKSFATFETKVGRVNVALAGLRDRHGVEGLTIEAAA